MSRSQCQDVNECLNQNGGCTGECINTAGSYYCVCSEDLVLAPDERTCVSPTSECRAMEPPIHGEVTVARISQVILDRSSRYTTEIYILKYLSKRWCTTPPIFPTHSLHFICRVKMFKKNSGKSGAARIAEKKKMENLDFEFETTGRN